MSVEAAAALFGSDSSDSDLFANLGPESVPENESHTHTNGDAQANLDSVFGEAASYSADSTEDLFGPSNDTTFPEYFPAAYDQGSQQDPIPHSYPIQTSYEAPTSSYSYEPLTSTQSYSDPVYPSQTAAPPNTYTPQQYTPPVSTYSTYNPPAPQAAPTPSTYSAYNSPAPQAPASSAYNIYAPPVSHHMSYTASATPPPPKPVTQPSVSALNRPKVTNAYDPPFVPATPRRTGRTGTATQASYLPAQQSYPAAPSHVVPPPPPAPPVASFTSPPATAVHAGSNIPRYASPLDPVAQTHSAQSQQYSSAEQQYSTTYTPPQESYEAHTYAQPQRSEVTRAYSNDSFNERASPKPFTMDEAADTLDSGAYRYDAAQNGTETNASHTYTYSQSEGRSSPYEPQGTSVESPPRVAPPQSRPSQTESPDLQKTQDVAPSADVAKTNGVAHSKPYFGHKERSPKDSFDPYAPKGNTYSNYIPRTSSPLSVPHDRPKPSTNGTASSPPNPHGLATYHPRPPLEELPLRRQPSQWSESKTAPQELYVKPPAPQYTLNAQYAPSPSLIGSNDPLARTSARVPLVSFGFGGKLITCFHGMTGMNTGFDVALSSRASSQLKMHVLQKLLPEVVLSVPPSTYPGPLLADPGTPSLSLVRSGASSQAKTKKAGILSYITGRLEEIRQGIAYLSGNERRSAEGKLILFNLLKIMVENDGRLSGTSQSDIAVRTALVPRLETASPNIEALGPTQGFKRQSIDETPISVTTTRPSALDTIEDLLLRGERHKASQFAMDEKLWAHAMIIASSIDKEAWKDVVNDFLRSEFPTDRSASANSSARGRESLRVAYSLFSGQGAAAVSELAPVSLLQRATLSVPIPNTPAMTPRSAHFPPTQKSIPPDALAGWAETVAMMLSTPLSLETSGALTALGDQLLANNLIEAAHVCYLLSPLTSPLGGFNGPSTRITLLGCKNPSDAFKDPDYLAMTEVLEFALSLVPPVKGQDPFHCLPHLQAYRFMRALSLAEIGNTQLAGRYCEAVTSTLSQNSPYTTPILLEQLQGFSQRLTGVQTDKSSWIGGKISKPSLDSIGGWLEGRFTKLVTGDSDSTAPIIEEKNVSESAMAGPFAHYSTISNTPSARSSPQPTLVNTMTFPPPPARTSSAMGIPSSYAPPPVERASSATGYRPSVQTSYGGTGSFNSSQSSPASSFMDKPASAGGSQGQRSPLIEQVETPIQGSNWWDTVNSASAKTPTAATFYQLDETSVPSSSSGFISLMDNQPLNVGPTPVSRQPSHHEELEDDGDLGLSTKSKPKPEVSDDHPAEENAKPQAESKPASQSGTKSWFSISRLWSGSGDSNTGSSGGPVKASLGEQSSFYYDKDLKRWINKNAKPEEPTKTATPPPPPSRAQTTSPGMNPAMRPPPSSATPPPPRSSSAMDLTTEPPTKVLSRMRSNLAPADTEPPMTPPGNRMSPAPPPSRPRSQATKRNIRSRYVDVFQQEGSPAP